MGPWHHSCRCPCPRRCPGPGQATEPTIRADRLAAITAGLDIDRDRGVAVGASLCATCVEVLDVSGAGIMLMMDGEHSSSLGVSNATIGIVEELQFTLGEGPCVDAMRTGEPVLEPDLAHPETHRWPAFTGPALDAGIRAVFGFPVTSGPVRLGSLDLYLDHPGALDATQQADAVALAAVIGHTVLAIQANTAPGTIPLQLEATIDHRAVVHQASGVLSAQLDISVKEALARIRAYSYAESQAINNVARAIVHRDLLLPAESG